LLLPLLVLEQLEQSAKKQLLLSLSKEYGGKIAQCLVENTNVQKRDNTVSTNWLGFFLQFGYLPEKKKCTMYFKSTSYPGS
jgi:hypothetical protein